MFDHQSSGARSSRLGGGARRALLFPLSVTVHGIVLLLLVILPLAGIELPSISEPVAAWVMPVVVPEPPAAPVPQARAARKAAELAVTPAPVVAPTRIGDENGLVVDPDFDLARTGTGNLGHPGGIVEGVTLDIAPPAPPPPPPPKALPIGGDVRPPRRISGAMPDYPTAARQARVEGVVAIEAIIDVTGRVTDARLLGGHPLLEQAALDAVRRWIYEPTRLNGLPVAVVIRVTVAFTLREP